MWHDGLKSNMPNVLWRLLRVDCAPLPSAVESKRSQASVFVFMCAYALLCICVHYLCVCK